MHDFTLGPPVDVDGYDGPLLDGKPLHEGNCEDGVYGCRMCNRAAGRLTDEELDKIGWQKTFHCDWCKKEVSIRELNGVRPWDEGGAVYYEICDACKKNYNQSLVDLDQLEDQLEEEEREFEQEESCGNFPRLDQGDGEVGWTMNEFGTYCPDCFRKHNPDAKEIPDPTNPGENHCSICGKEMPR